MTRNKSPTGAGQAEQRRTSHYRLLESMLDVLEAHEHAGRAARRVNLVPDAGPPALRPTLRSLPPSAWPGFGTAGKPMSPLPGWSMPEGSMAGMPVAVVGIFGLDARETKQAIDQVARQQRQSMAFLPVFFTDRADHGPFRRQGYIVEYFPPEIAADAAGPDGFRDRFSLLWRKWGASRLIDLSAAGQLEPLIRGLAVLNYRSERGERDREWERPARPPAPLPSPDVAALRAEYAQRGLGREPDSFVLYRIIGNDLYPRHETGQSLRNVRFILEHEPALPGCEKRWLVNRIVDKRTEAELLDLLDRAAQPYLHIPFDWQEYARQDWDFSGIPDPGRFRFDELSPRMRLRADARLRRHKINYVVNNNGARNAALMDGRGRAKWVLPWDGNCFLTSGAWEELVSAVTSRPYLKYFYVPMARLTDNAPARLAGFRPEAVEEPQILFRRDAEETFDEAFPYGRRPKVSLFWRLGIPGGWDDSRDDIWDLPRPQRSPRGTEFGKAGWVARLSSGRAELEESTRLSQSGREVARNEALIATLDELDVAATAPGFDAARLMAYDEATIAGLAAAPDGSLAATWRSTLIHAAEATIARGLSLLDDQRLPGSIPPSPESDSLDRIRLHRLLDGTTISALAWRVSGDLRFAEHAAALVRRYFLDPATAMSPEMKFAQWRPEQEPGPARGLALIEMKDLYFFLDAVRLISTAGALRPAEQASFRDWLGAYLEWIHTSPHGAAERKAGNERGTCHDLQVGAIAAYLGDVGLLLHTLRTAKARLLSQIGPDGTQAEEFKRSQSAHYTVFNLQCWMNLARLAQTVGCDLWTFEGPGGQSLRAAINWLLPLLASQTWPFPQSDPFDRARLVPLLATAGDRMGILLPDPIRAETAQLAAWPPSYGPYDGIKPFWLLDHLDGGAKAALSGRQ